MTDHSYQNHPPMQVQDLGGWFGDMLFKLLLLLILMNFSIKINSVFYELLKTWANLDDYG
ncbi:hypothetical protein C0134_06445 [Moraxella catarrhalis]|nr:hypothetical protein E9M_08608 [Moraxella catarrhalis 46P47B1]MPW83141.1 hypothetical protein [Moraxella catarrhalis]MPW95071.1 hypothetical protein [Moraxella catarrhalis]MPX21134.1 hypothetical protein [Moraxella catarrhalis]MPX22956.1 hypothetical protein [Moraxella catarrhalis]